MLADEFFLIAWDTTRSGKPRLSAQAIGLGLAGGLIGELVLQNRLTVHGPTLAPTARHHVADRLSDGVLAEIREAPQHTDVRTWLAYLARDAVPSVAERLIRSGLVEHEPPRAPWRRRGRYYSRDFGKATWPTIRLQSALVKGRRMTPSDMAMAALVDACGLLETVVPDPAERSTARRYLTAVLAATPPQLTDLTRHVHAAVGDAVLAYRG
ncbi:GPP34 family phosphoprotein [Spongiactinospora sp. TRM90649]|uniref:GOLPH3/VPS74 family protein n=1 Tax=Spongiactinospora sp. TRM90649 TaxID=3031114 RepID=UPI0023F684AC|nr:GPP34 family phosphoprotein [Spongiactinospora sp. TRM90649]MDF5758279.1 GPP34 family phosphoprotein [Spongiactinospora sp. TRM90649]